MALKKNTLPILPAAEAGEAWPTFSVSQTQRQALINGTPPMAQFQRTGQLPPEPPNYVQFSSSGAPQQPIATPASAAGTHHNNTLGTPVRSTSFPQPITSKTTNPAQPPTRSPILPPAQPPISVPTQAGLGTPMRTTILSQSKIAGGPNTSQITPSPTIPLAGGAPSAQTGGISHPLQASLLARTTALPAQATSNTRTLALPSAPRAWPAFLSFILASLGLVALSGSLLASLGSSILLIIAVLGVSIAVISSTCAIITLRHPWHSTRSRGLATWGILFDLAIVLLIIIHYV